MCLSSPKVQTTTVEAPAVATEVDSSVQDARERERKRLAAARLGSTLLNGGQGLTNKATTAPKTLLGE